MNIDLNCDLGEGEPLSQTEILIRAISSCNVACGGHAGDERSMRDTVQLAKRYRVAVGAHPSFADRLNFGRVVQPIDQRGLRTLLTDQVGALDRVLRTLAVPLHHIKLHGALYNLVESNESLARVYGDWAKENYPGVPFIALAGGCVMHVMKNSGARVAAEFFSDRAYTDAGTLVSREKAGAVLQDPAEIYERVLRVLRDNCVVTATGKTVAVQAETICVHGDNPGAPEIVRHLCTRLQKAGIEVRAF